MIALNSPRAESSINYENGFQIHNLNLTNSVKKSTIIIAVVTY